MESVQLPKDFKDFLRLLNEHDVRYLLIGGYAVGYYGYPRATQDMDIWIATDLVNARNMVDVMTSFGFSEGAIDETVFLRGDGVVRMGVPPLRLAVLMQISGVDFEECYRRGKTVEVDDVEISIIHLEDLVANKRASGRHKDLDDLEHLPDPLVKS